MGSYSKANIVHKLPRLSMGSLQRTISDISAELSSSISSKEAIDDDIHLPTVSEVEDAKCECCGLSEECMNEYIDRVRSQFSGKLICGLCAEAVKEEMDKNGGKQEAAVNEHMSSCEKFSRLGRAYPVLYQAEAIREIFQKSSRIRAKSMSPRDESVRKSNGGIARSSSCISAINREELISPKP
ncbi:hypothetical protein D8674_034437 [Pyrus ussuriensis x Pyrus communis]|uniref:DUF1677 domain-containing protein n=1 Tax=Pyrus ussuriensis x Pyrus communis TaxID=2448454 RepID=A0A5N5HU02_9ROSA|nr:hypothetical protein D8674_034437 [Pyrus ussuriensis x Pyrus communis]